MKDTINNYSKLSSDQLMIEFAKHVATQKQKDGGEEMKKTIERLKPFLNIEQWKRLEEVLKSVEN